MKTDAYKLSYDTLAVSTFSEGEQITFSGGGVGELIILRDFGNNTGEMYFNLLSGSVPANNETITGGTSTATAAVDETIDTVYQSRFPLYIRDDTSKNASGDIRWTGPNLGTTHSCKYDGETGGPFTLNETLTFSGGATAELIQLTDNGTSGILFFRLIGSTIPLDNETISGGTSGAGAAVDGVVSERCYTPQELHYWFSDLGDDSTFLGDDVQDRTRERVSSRVFDTIVTALGSTNIDDTLSYHMYGGSWSQSGGDDLYSGLDIAIVDPIGTTEPVIIQNNALLSDTTTEYWKNAYMSSAAARVRLMIKTRTSAADIDRKVVRLRALERFDSYFTAPDVTLDVGIVSTSLVTSDDGNDTTSNTTVSGYTDVVLTTGYQLVDHNNNNGAQPYWLEIDRGSRSKTQTHERGKWLQRRGTTETIYGLNYQLFVGNDLDIPFDNEAVSNFSEGETITWTGGGSALVLAVSATGSGILYCQILTGDVPTNNTVITGGTSTTTADVNGDPTTRLITNSFVGTYTGSAFNPANRGITLEPLDADNADLFTDLLGAQQSPPNNQSGTVNTTTGNYVTIFPWDGTTTDAVGDQAPDFDRLTLNGALSGATVTSVVVNQTIPTWAPTSGNLRITLSSGLIKLVSYTSFSGSTFTIPSTDFSSDNAANGAGCMPASVDGIVSGGQATFTGVYTINQNAAGSGDQQFVIKTQRGSGATPKQPSVNVATFGSGGFSVNVTLQDD